MNAQPDPRPALAPNRPGMTMDPDKRRVVRTGPKIDHHPDAIKRFEGEFDYLANVYRSKVYLAGDFEPYPSVEHAFQASKTSDVELRDKIRVAKTAIDAKKLSRGTELTEEWKGSSEKVMEGLVRDKFRRHEKYRDRLLDLGHRKLTHTNDFNDKVWGVCDGKGDNKLGKLLERVREDIRQNRDTILWAKTQANPPPLEDLAVGLTVTKNGQVVDTPLVEHKSIIQMGKLKDNDVVMEAPSVSRFHALLLIDKELGPLLVDLAAPNGTFVDGERIPPYTPTRIVPHETKITFAHSPRQYVVTQLELAYNQIKTQLLYAKMADPEATKSTDTDNVAFVANLPYSATEPQLRELFSECGEITNISLPLSKETGQIRGIAFITFGTATGVSKALQMDGDDVDGRNIKVKRSEAKPKSKPQREPENSRTAQKDQAPPTLQTQPPPTRAPQEAAVLAALALQKAQEALQGKTSSTSPAKRGNSERSPPPKGRQREDDPPQQNSANGEGPRQKRSPDADHSPRQRNGRDGATDSRGHRTGRAAADGPQGRDLPGQERLKRPRGPSRSRSPVNRRGGDTQQRRGAPERSPTPPRRREMREAETAARKERAQRNRSPTPPRRREMRERGERGEGGGASPPRRRAERERNEVVGGRPESPLSSRRGRGAEQGRPRGEEGEEPSRRGGAERQADVGRGKRRQSRTPTPPRRREEKLRRAERDRSPLEAGTGRQSERSGGRQRSRSRSLR